MRRARASETPGQAATLLVDSSWSSARFLKTQIDGNPEVGIHAALFLARRGFVGLVRRGFVGLLRRGFLGRTRSG